MKIPFKSLTLALSVSLGGCAVYGPPPTYTYYESAPAATVYSQPAPVYVQPAPVYVHPAPVYAGPPVWFGFNFGYRSGGHRHHHWRGHRR
jgi:hypothetical protein